MESITIENGNPPAAYQRNTSTSNILNVNRDFYDSAHNNVSNNNNLIQDFIIPIRSGRAWEVKKGQVCRVIAVEGPQVGDFNVWNFHNPREKMWASRTRQLEKAHISIYDRIWSTLPYLQPLLTVTGDSLKNYGKDKEGGRVHDLLGTRCDPYVNKLLTGIDYDFCCHSNLTRAILPYGLVESDVHDVLNIFQCTGLNDLDKYFMKSCPAKKGDYFEFFAEMDLLCALSTCPSGDQSIPLWGPDTTDIKLKEICRPLQVQVYDVDKLILKNWSVNANIDNKYRNYHGFQFPS